MIAHDGMDGRTSITVYGDLDESAAPQLETLLGEVAVAPEHSIVVDLTDCTYVSSVAISVMVRAFRSRGERFRVTIPPDGVIHRIFRISGLIGVFAFTGPQAV